MATTSAYTLHPPHADDSMDVSSPGARTNDDDIEIDFEDYDAAPATLTDDERMIDEPEDQTEIVHDAVMEDDELTMDDNKDTTHTTYSALHDEDLIDYSDEEEPPPPPPIAKPIELIAPAELQHEEPVLPPVITQTTVEETNHALLDESDAEPLLEFEEHDDFAEEGDSVESIAKDTKGEETLTSETEKVSENAEAAAVVSTASKHNQGEGGEDKHEETKEDDRDENEPGTSETADINGSTIAPSTDHEPEANAQQHDQTADSPSLAEGARTPTDTGLHPILFYYDDEAIPLFRSKSLPDGLLKDDNLVSVSLADLMKACRQRLAIKNDSEIDDGVEILLTFENLQGLMVAEDSPASFQTSLKDVLDVFLQLHENDGFSPQDAPALEITCELHTKFNISIVNLQNLAANGRGMSTFARTEVPREDHDIQHDEFDNDDAPPDDTAEDYEEPDYTNYDHDHPYVDDDTQRHEQDDAEHTDEQHSSNAQEGGIDDYTAAIAAEEEQQHETYNIDEHDGGSNEHLDTLNTAHPEEQPAQDEEVEHEEETLEDDLHAYEDNAYPEEDHAGTEPAEQPAEQPAIADPASQYDISADSATEDPNDDELDLDFLDDHEETNPVTNTTGLQETTTPHKRGREVNEDDNTGAGKKPRTL